MNRLRAREGKTERGHFQRLTLDSALRALPARSYAEGIQGTPDTSRATLRSSRNQETCSHLTGTPASVRSPQAPLLAPRLLLREPRGRGVWFPSRLTIGPQHPGPARSLSVNPDVINTPSIVLPEPAGEACIWNLALEEIKVWPWEPCPGEGEEGWPGASWREGRLRTGGPASLVPAPPFTSVTLDKNFSSLGLSFHMCKMGLQHPPLREKLVGV